MPKDIVKSSRVDGSKEPRGGFDTIGDLAIIKPPKNLNAADVRRLANSIIKKNKHIRGVFKKIGKIEGIERVQRLVWVCGGKSPLVIHKENGCSFYVDVKKVFFTPRLCSERLRISKLVKPKEIVLDMFCGVGPYSVQIAKRAKKVYAIDINPEAIRLLKLNLRLNKLENVKVFVGDSKKVVPKLNEIFDRVIMNFPLNSKAFLLAAIKACKETSVIHYYCFVNAKEGYASGVKIAIKDLMAIIPSHVKVLRIEDCAAGEVAPYLTRTCLDIYLRK